MNESLLLPALLMLALLSALHAKVNVYDAFVKGAKEGLATAVEIAPYLAAVLTAVALLRETGLMDAAQRVCAPLLTALGLPAESVGTILLRPLSGSAALASVADVLKTAGPDSRAARLCCVISGASETVFFTGSLYLGAAGVRRSRYAVPVSLAAYAVGVLAAALVVRYSRNCLQKHGRVLPALFVNSLKEAGHCTPEALLAFSCVPEPCALPGALPRTPPKGFPIALWKPSGT